MEWVDKMDLVFEKLYVESGHAPTMQKLNNWLSKKDIEIGEIQDITLHLYRDKYIYCCVNGDRNANYKDDGIFLMSAAGKLFWENERGYKAYFQKLATEKAEKVANDLRLVRWTKRLTVATILAATLIVAWEAYKTFCLEGFHS